MINKDRLVKQFIKMVSIDSISMYEKEMSSYLAKEIEKMGYRPVFDGASRKIDGNSDNLIFKVKGNKDVAPIALVAHMDTVTPGTKKEAVIDGDYITSSKGTVLGGDDFAGICVILEAIRVLKEQNIPHGDIYVVFTVAEEIGLFGSKSLDYSKINAKYGFVLDNGGPIGTVAAKTPTQLALHIQIEGKEAHAGVEPEKGISAINVAAEAISNMKLGRIDEETTANIGTITGGSATNVVCGMVYMNAEIRSLKDEKIIETLKQMVDSLENACAKTGALFDIDQHKEYVGYDITKDESMVNILKKASDETNIPLNLAVSGGGSDANILNSNGIISCNLSVGMDKIHTKDEQIKMSDMVDATKFLIGCIKNVE